MTGYPSIDKPWLKYYRREKINTAMPKMTMYDYMRECSKNNLDGIAMIYYGNKISYKKMLEEIDKAAISLIKMGIKDGDVVSVAAPFLPEVVYAVYAINKIGAVVNMVDPRVPVEKLRDYISKSGSKTLVMIDKCFPKIEKIYDKTELKTVISISPALSLPFYMKLLSRLKDGVGPIPAQSGGRYIKWEDFIKIGEGHKVSCETAYRPNKPAIIIYTSGTSGEPKGAVSSNESFNSMALLQTDSITETAPGDKFLLIMPPFIAYGLSIGLHNSLCTNQTLLMIPTFNIDNSAEMLGTLVKKHRPQTIMGVPAFMTELIKHPAMQKADLSFLKYVIVGGDSMVPEHEAAVNAFLAERGSAARVTKGWGLTEVNSCFSFTKSKETNPLGSVGIPLFANNIKVVKPIPEDVAADDVDFDALEELPYDHEGELFISSPTVIIDYLDNQEESKRVFFKSKYSGETWIRTKDIGHVTKDGLIYIGGRMKRIIIRPDGHNVSPFAIENIVNSIPMVDSCIAVGRKLNGQAHGALPVVYIKLKEEYLGSEQAVIEESKTLQSRMLPPRDVAFFYEFVTEMPLTDVGKIDYKKFERIESERLLQKRNER